MLLLHLSDTHLSRYGERSTWTHRSGEDPDGWENLQRYKDWEIEGQRDAKGHPVKLRLVDPEGVVHAEKSWPQKDDKAIKSLIELAIERQRTSAEELLKDRPNRDDLAAMLRVDPDNTNLRFLEVLDQVLPLEPEIVVITGDLTDNGFGYRLVEHYLKPWIDRERFFAVPGNHDTYDIIPTKGSKFRRDAKEKRWAEFAAAIGNAPEEGQEAYARYAGDVAIVGLSSCKAPKTPFSASGAVSKGQLKWLAALAADATFQSARKRVCLVHHHLLRMPFELGKRAPLELGMRMRNAPAVMDACRDAKIDLILHGHRHHGYMVQLPGLPLVVSSPSSTLGCVSTDMRYVWLKELGNATPYPILHELDAVDPHSAVR